MTPGIHHPLLEPLHAAERLGPEDRAARAADEHLADALLAQQLRAAGGAYYRRGVCANCEAACREAAVYCDADCRADHEERLRQLARRGG